MSDVSITNKDRRKLHEELDAAFDLPGLTGIHCTIMAFTGSNDVDVTLAGKGSSCPDEIIVTTLRSLLDLCRDFGTRNSRSMIPAIACAISYMEHLHEQGECCKSHENREVIQ